MMKIMEMHAQNVICGPQKKKIKKKLFLAKLFTKNQKSIPNLPQVTLLSKITYLVLDTGSTFNQCFGSGSARIRQFSHSGSGSAEI